MPLLNIIFRFNCCASLSVFCCFTNKVAFKRVHVSVARCAIKSRTGAPFDGRARLVFVVRAGAPFGAPFYTCARVWRYFFYAGYYAENMYNFEANRVSKWCFSLLGVSLVNNFQKMALFDTRLFIGHQNSEKNCSHLSTFFHFLSMEMCFYKCKMLLNTNLSTFLPILYAKFNTQKCARLWRALVRLFTPVCATFWKIIWQHWSGKWVKLARCSCGLSYFCYVQLNG